MYTITKGVLNFSEDTKIIEKNAFVDNKEIKKIILPENLEKIETRAFSNCDNLKEIEFNKNLFSIGTEAFLNCKKIEKIKLTNKIKVLHESCFENCTSLKDVEISSRNQVMIGHKVFKNTKIENLKLRKFDYFADSFGTNILATLKSIYIDMPSYGIDYDLFFADLPKAAKESKVENITIYDRKLKKEYKDFIFDCDDRTFLTAYPHKKKDDVVIIPEGTTKIDSSTFMGNPYIRRIIIPESIKELNVNIANSCPNLESIVFKGITEINSRITMNCENIKSIYISKECAEYNKAEFVKNKPFKIFDIDFLIEEKSSFKEINKAYKDFGNYNLGR